MSEDQEVCGHVSLMLYQVSQQRVLRPTDPAHFISVGQVHALLRETIRLKQAYDFMQDYLGDLEQQVVNLEAEVATLKADVAAAYAAEDERKTLDG